MLAIHENIHLTNVFGLMNGAESGFVVVYFEVISLQNDVNDIQDDFTALTKSRPISSPAHVMLDKKNIESELPQYSR